MTRTLADQLAKSLKVLLHLLLQALMELKEVFPAVQAAEKAVELDPTWSVARQTLGRAQLGLGEVYMVRDQWFGVSVISVLVYRLCKISRKLFTWILATLRYVFSV